MSEFEEMTVEQAIERIRSLASWAPTIFNAAADGLDEAIKQGVILPSDTFEQAKTKIETWQKSQND